mgnify:CR=1 FL=1
MKLSSRSISKSGVIPGRCAFAVQSPAGHIRISHNRNPHLAWRGAPAATKSFVLACIDTDVPTSGENVNREGLTVPASLPRTEFVHWLMINIPPTVTEIAEGACSQGVTAHGKTAPAGPDGSVQGLNDYTNWFAGDAAMEGRYLGYDGPCPPWNDEIVHHYRFKLFACDLASLPLAAGFTLAELRAALKDHVLARDMLVGRYTLNPALRLR